jgi:thiol-disulfide isomerase/thioredoxin
MGKQFLVWFGAALLGGIVLVVAGSFWQHGGPPPKLVDAVMSTRLGRSLAQHWLDASAPPAPAGAQVLQRGDAVPDLTLRGLDGRMHRLAEWHGKRVLLNFWATWCGPCREEMPALAAAQRRYAGNGVQVIGIAMDEPLAVHDYLKRTPVDYPILLGLGADRDLSLLFGNTRGALPFSVLIGADGRIEGTRLGKLDERQLRWWLE